MKQIIDNLFVASSSALAVIAVCTLVFSFGFVEFSEQNPQTIETTEGK